MNCIQRLALGAVFFCVAPAAKKNGAKRLCVP